MANRVVVNICGEEYTFVAEESASYMQKVGSYVSEKMDEVLNGAKVGRFPPGARLDEGGHPHRRQHHR